MTDNRGISPLLGPSWHAQAACAGTGDVMFPDPTDKIGIATALTFCQVCPVQAECLAAAMAAEGGKKKESRYGMCGGLLPGQRYYLYNNKRTRPEDVPKEPEEPPRKPSTRPLAPCGTRAAYERHLRNHEPVCDPCRLAHNAARRASKAKAKAAPCGTRSAYQRHLRKNEPPCDACRQANTDTSRQRRQARSQRSVGAAA